MEGNKINTVMYCRYTYTPTHTYNKYIYIYIYIYNDEVNCDNDKKNTRFYND